MADAPASLEAVYLVVRVLRGQGLEHAFIGGIALNAWGLPRATFDVDLAVALDPAKLGPLLDAFERESAVVDSAFRKGFLDKVAGLEKFHLHLPAGQALLAVDLFVARTAFLASVLARRVEIDLGAGPLWVCTAADLILFKLLADRKKDRVDIENVIAVQGIPEREYLVTWATKLGLRPRLDALLQER